MDKTLKWVLIGGIVAVSCSMVYYFLWFVPNKEASAEERRQEEKVASCLKGVREKYDEIYANLLDQETHVDPKILESGLVRYSEMDKQEQEACKK